MSFKTVTRNPNHIDGKIFCSSWQSMVVVFNGTLLDPSQYYEVKGSRYGLSPDGYVNFVDKVDGNPQGITDKSTGLVLAVKVKQMKGHVAIVRHSQNDCGMCITLMQSGAWWKPDVFTNANPPQLKQYTAKQMEGLKLDRIQTYNNWCAEYEKRVGQSAARVMNPQPIEVEDRSLPVVSKPHTAQPKQQRKVVKSG